MSIRLRILGRPLKRWVKSVPDRKMMRREEEEEIKMGVLYYYSNRHRHLLMEAIFTIPFQLILDRISKGIHDKVSKGSDLTQALFNFAYKYKCGWMKRGFDTPLMNRYIFFLSPVWDFFSSLKCVNYQNIKCKYKIQEKSMSVFFLYQHNYKCGVIGYEARWRFNMTADFRKIFESWITCCCMKARFIISLDYVEVA